MKRTEKTTAKHLSFSSSSLHSLQRKAVVLPSCIGRGRGLSIALLLAVLWLVGIPVGAKSITTVSPQPNVVAAADTSMVAYTEMKTCTKIPSAYKNKIDSVLKENLYVIELNGTNSWSFTTDFVIKEMESDWGISKDNQLMFIWISLCEVLSGEYPYDGESGDSKMIEEFEKAFKYIDACGKRYKVGIMPFIEKACAEYDRQSAEARKQSAEARKQSAEYIKETMMVDSTGIRDMIKAYNNRTTNTCEEVIVKNAVKGILQDCHKRGIDYKAIMRRELGDDKKVKDLLKFYGIE